MEFYEKSNDAPIEIEWLSKQGLNIKRKISFDENFMITIEDVVLNKLEKQSN